MDDDGQPSTYAPGHGDLPDALRRSGLLAHLRRRRGQVRLDCEPRQPRRDHRRGAPRLVHRERRGRAGRGGAEGRGRQRGHPRLGRLGRRVGRVVRRLQVLEEFRLPPGFDADAVRVFNTNTFLVRAERAPRREVTLRVVRGREEGRRPGRACSSSACSRSSPPRCPPPTSASRATAPARDFSR